MDGYALSSSKTTLASPTNPLTFRVSGSIAAGDSPLTLEDDDSMTCYEIMTGAAFPLSTGYDACVRHEAVTYQPQAELEAGSSCSSFPRARTITIHEPIPSRSNRKLAGEDFRQGDVLARAGTIVTPGIVMVLSSTGIDRVQVEPERGTRMARKQRLRIGILTTGKEVANNHNLPTGSASPATSSDEPGSAVIIPNLQKGHIFNSNAPYLVSTLDCWGHDPVVIPAPTEDTPEAFQERLRAAVVDPSAPLDLIVTTGGVSAGKHDYVPSSVIDLGGRIVFHKTIIRPGFPVMFGEIPRNALDKDDKVPIFGLPGNPIAVAACLRFLVAAFLRESAGPSSTLPGVRVARLLSPDFSASRGGPHATAGCGVEKMPRNVTGQTEHRARYHKKPLMTRCFLPSRIHQRRPEGAVDMDGPGENIRGLNMLPWVEPLTRSASLTKAMSEANCWVVLPEGREVFEPGEIVEIVSMRPE